MTIEINFIFQILDSVFLQGDFFGLGDRAGFGSDDPIIKGMLPSAFVMIGFALLLNLFNAGVRKKLVDQVKLKRIMKETRAWQKERMAAFRSKDDANEYATNDDYNYSIIDDFLFCTTNSILIYCSSFSNSTKCNPWRFFSTNLYG